MDSKNASPSHPFALIRDGEETKETKKTKNTRILSAMFACFDASNARRSQIAEAVTIILRHFEDDPELRNAHDADRIRDNSPMFGMRRLASFVSGAFKVAANPDAERITRTVFIGDARTTIPALRDKLAHAARDLVAAGIEPEVVKAMFTTFMKEMEIDIDIYAHAPGTEVLVEGLEKIGGLRPVHDL